MNFWTGLVILAVAAFFQNMAFTWTSRSRNSGDPAYHRFAAWSSNGVWFITQFFVWKTIWPILMNDLTLSSSGKLLLVAIVYILATTEGSVLMMKILLKRERGSRRVGALEQKSV